MDLPRAKVPMFVPSFLINYKGLRRCDYLLYSYIRRHAGERIKKGTLVKVLYGEETKHQSTSVVNKYLNRMEVAEVLKPIGNDQYLIYCPDCEFLEVRFTYEQLRTWNDTTIAVILSDAHFGKRLTAYGISKITGLEESNLRDQMNRMPKDFFGKKDK